MLLNPLSQQFVIYLSPNTFYSDVYDLWKPVIKRLYLPYVSLEDFFNANITQISFPSIQASTVQQSIQNYKLQKRQGLQLDQSMDKQLTLTVKLTESYISYFMARQQFDLFLQFCEVAPLYFPPIFVSILDDGGFETITYAYTQLTPTGLSDFDLSYSAKPAQFNTFTWTFSYNYFDIWYRNPDGHRVKIESNDAKYGMLKKDKIINPDDPKYIGKNIISSMHKRNPQMNGVFINQSGASSSVTGNLRASLNNKT